MNNLDAIRTLIKKAEDIKSDLSQKVSEAQIYSYVDKKKSDFKNSKLYKSSIEIKDAYSDARDSFSKMDAIDYAEYCLVNAPTIRVDENTKYEELINKLKELILKNNYNILLYKYVIDPIDNKEKVFKIGVLHNDNSNEEDKLIILCNDTYKARLIIEELKLYGYSFIENKKESLVKRFINSCK